MIIRRMVPMSFAKLSATLYALVGLLIGGFVSLASIVGGAAAGSDAGGPIAMLFGAAAIVLLPVFYGCVGFVTTLVGAALYNLVAGWVGGVEIEVQ